MSRSRTALAAILAVGALLLSSPTASAEQHAVHDKDGVEDFSSAEAFSFVSKISDSVNPIEEFLSLSETERGWYLEFIKPVAVATGDEVLMEVPVSQEKLAELGIDGSAKAPSPSVQGWSVRVTQDWTSRWGFAVARQWQAAEWVTQNGQVVSWQRTERGGQGLVFGHNYTGTGGDGSRNVGWEFRSYTQENFTFGISFLGVGSSFTGCIQLRGGQGEYSFMANCDLNL